MTWAWRKRVCPKCGYLVPSGERVFQLSRGTCAYPSITPTGGSLIGEWHESHFEDYALKPQAGQYACLVCGVEIKNSEVVIYGVIGKKPANPYARAERRGYDLQLVAHENCWEKVQDQILSRKLQEFGKKYEAGLF